MYKKQQTRNTAYRLVTGTKRVVNKKSVYFAFRVTHQIYFNHGKRNYE